MTPADPSSDLLEVKVGERDGRTVVTLTGEVDVATAPLVGRRISDLVNQGSRDLVVDLAGVSFLDSTGLRVLLRVSRQLDDVGGHLEVASPSAVVARVLEITGLDQAFHVTGAASS